MAKKKNDGAAKNLDQERDAGTVDPEATPKGSDRNPADVARAKVTAGKPLDEGFIDPEATPKGSERNPADVARDRAAAA